MTWRPNLEKAKVDNWPGGLLGKALGTLIATAFVRISGRLSDKDGTFAILTDREVLTAKEYVYGNIVSAHKRAVYSALNQNIPLVMWIDDAERFYAFDPKGIINNSQENVRGESIMLNFDIKLGRRYEGL